MPEQTVFQKQQLAVSYAALLLSDAAQEITADNLSKVAKAAGVTIDKLFLDTFAQFVTPAVVEELANRVSKVGAGAPAAGGAEAPAAAEAAAPVEESEEESDDDMGMDLFG